MPLWVAFFILGCTPIGLVSSHQEAGDWSCDPDPEKLVQADFRPGTVTLDGRAEDWKDVHGFEFPLFPATRPREKENVYRGGKMTVKALHDGKDVFFMLQVNGEYAYSKGNDHKCPSVGLMFQVGEKASYHRMGGCEESKETCNNETCRGHEVDIMHFSIGNAIPGRLYGGDGFGDLVDQYAWNPHCRFLDGINSPRENDSSAQNNWRGAWWHDSFTKQSGFVEEDSPYAASGQNGNYYFEFSRPLRTMDRFQQDVQFTIGGSSKISVAFWYPLEGNPWIGSGHYSVSCDWFPLDISMGIPTKVVFSNSWDAASAASLLLSVASFFISVFVAYRLSKTESVPFTPMDSL